MKQCTKCLIEKEESEFYVGVSACMVCKRAYAKEHSNKRGVNPEYKKRKVDKWLFYEWTYKMKHQGIVHRVCPTCRCKPEDLNIDIKDI